MKYAIITPNITSSEISVVVQGPVNKIRTKKTLKSIRKHLPNAEIILSTWENSDIDGLDYDKLVLTEDIGGVLFDETNNKLNNLNRILISSQNGIKEASRKYILRMRSDLYLENDNILKLSSFLPKRNAKNILFKNRIFAYEIFSKKYDYKKNTKQRILFHISDWCHFGLNEDIKELFNIPLVKEPEFSRYFENFSKPCVDIHNERLWKMSPEQYITSMNAKKVFKDLLYKHYLDNTEENINISEEFIINNFVTFTNRQWGIKTLKSEYKAIRMITECPFDYYSKLEQLKDYQKYCDADFKNEFSWLLKLYKIEYYRSLKKHFFSLFFCSIDKKCSELFSTLFYLLKLLEFLLWGKICKKK